MRYSGRHRTAVLLGALAALVACFPAQASAGAHANIRHNPGQSAAFTVAASNGYTLNVKSEKGILTVTASRGRPGVSTISPGGRLVAPNRGNIAWTSYLTETPKDPGTIEADLGALGKFTLAFQPSGQKRVTNVDLENKSERCVGATKIVRNLGVFTGTLSFHGEDGYTTVDTTSAPGSVGTSPFRNCTTLHHRAARVSGAPSAQEPTTSLWMISHGDSGLGLFAITDHSGTDFTAFEGETLAPQVLVFRQAIAVAPRQSFHVSPSLDRAVLHPPAPFFSGLAVYGDPPRGAPYLKGTLAVSFPGLKARLTGPGFDPPKLKVSNAGP